MELHGRVTLTRIRTHPGQVVGNVFMVEARDLTSADHARCRLHAIVVADREACQAWRWVRLVPVAVDRFAGWMHPSVKRALRGRYRWERRQ